MTGHPALLLPLLDEGALLLAWEQIRNRERAKHGDLRPATAEFAGHAARTIAHLASAITAGTYQPDPLATHRARKRSGGTRRLVTATPRDRVVERAVLNILDPVVDRLLLPTSFGYRRGLGVNDALSCLIGARDAGAGWVLRADIERCFDSIPRSTALEVLNEHGIVPPWAWVIALLLNRQVTGAQACTGLYQGAALSPLMANLVLDRVDREVTASGIELVRYGDDLAVPLYARDEAPRSLAVLRRATAAQGLQLHEDKSLIEDVNVGVHFLGQTVTDTTQAKDTTARPVKATVFVSGPNALLRSKGDRLRVEIDGEVKLSLSLLRLRQVVCHGRVGVTTPLLHRVMGLGIDVVFLSDHGRYIGRCASTGHIRAGRRRHQYIAAAQPETCLAVAKMIIIGKLTNLRTGLMRWSRNQVLTQASQAVSQIERCRDQVVNAQTIGEVMGHEGTATAAYFRHLSVLVGPEWEFRARTRRPPTDRVSSMLSFGYALLTMELIAATEIAGLDPYVGFLHAEGRGRPSLALDLIEEFRCVVVDSVVLRLIRTKTITIEDFRVDPDRGILLTDAARRRYFAEYERRMLTTFSHAPSGRRVSYRAALSLQAGILASAVERGSDYQPVAWK